jgi:hypothetical protein
MHAITQQIQSRDSHYEDVAKAIWGNNSSGAPTHFEAPRLANRVTPCAHRKACLSSPAQ